MASTGLSRTCTQGNNKTATLSVWLKRAGGFGSEQYILGFGLIAGAYTQISFNSSDNINVYNFSGGGVLDIRSYAKRRDPAAWLHFCVAFDSSQNTESNRIKYYINGTQITGSDLDVNYPALNADCVFNNNGQPCTVGMNNSSSGYYNGSMAMMEWVDGLQLDPTYFGSFDSASGIWTPTATSTISDYGVNGFKLAMDTSTPGADTSGNTNNFTVGAGTPTLTQGSPSNVFATMNPLIPGQTNYTYSNGNLTITQGSSAWVKSNSTIGMSSGKYYWEAKYVSGLYTVVGVDKTDTATPYPSTSSSAVGWKRNGNVEVGTTPQTDIASYAHGDIVSVALDMDNACVYFGKGGVWQNSGDPTSGASKTGAYSLPSYVANTPYFATVSPYESGATSMNFGEGFFGTTAAGTQADDNGQGLFAYDVPAGYYALNTKNLEAYG